MANMGFMFQVRVVCSSRVNTRPRNALNILCGTPSEEIHRAFYFVSYHVGIGATVALLVAVRPIGYASPGISVIILTAVSSGVEEGAVKV